MTTRHVRPSPIEGQPDQVARIRDPETGEPLTAEGKTVTWSDFWAKRLLDGDLVVDQPETDTGKTPVEPSAAKAVKPVSKD